MDSEIRGMFGNEKVKTGAGIHTLKQVKFMKHNSVCWRGRTKVIRR